MGKRSHLTSLVALLILSTMLWGSVAAGHIHLEPHSQLCDICLLPHAATVGEQIPAPLSAPAPSVEHSFRNTPYNPAVLPPYHGRAPPR